MFTYSTAAGTSGVYYNEVRLGDIPAIQSSGNYGGGVRLSNPSDDVYMWIDAELIRIRRVGETAVYTGNWRTLLDAPGSEWIVLAIDSDEESNDGRFYMMLYDTNAHVIRIGAMVMARFGTALTVISPGTYFNIPLIDLNDALPLEKFQQRTTGYDTGNRDGAIDISISRGALWIYMTEPDPESGLHDRPATLVHHRLRRCVQRGATGALERNTNLDTELLPSNAGVTVEIIKHENIDAIEDAYTHSGTRNIWHYRDPNQLIVRWPNITEKPPDATIEEMELGTESGIRFMSPAGVAREIIVRGLYRGMLITGDTFYPGDIGEVASGEYWLRTGPTGTQLPVDDATQWHSLNGGTLLGANQVTAINDILKRIPRDIELMAQREGPQYQTAGWDRYIRYNVGTPVGIGSIAEDPHSSINGLIYWLGTDRDIFQHRLVLHTNEADGPANRGYDDKYIRFNGQSYQLEYSERTTAGDGNRYRTKETITGVPFPDDNQAARVTWTVNFEDIQEAASETVGGPPWLFFSVAGPPITDGGAADTGVDDVVNSLTLDLVSANELRLTAGRTVGAQLVSNIVTLPAGGGGTADGVVSGATLAVTGQQLSMTLDRSIGADVTASVTLPAGGGGLSTVNTESPVSGDGSTGTPVTVADGAINLVHLSNGARYHRGNWNSNQVYVRSQSVEHDGHLWVNVLGSSLGDTPSLTSTVWYRIDHRPTEVQDQGTLLTENANLLNFTGTGVTATASDYDITVNIPGSGLSIAGLPNQASTQLADTDVMVMENVSEANAQKHLTMGSLSAFLADGTTITSAGGKLTAVAESGSTVAFKAPLDAVTITNLTATWLDVTQISTADIEFNEGAFTVEAQADTTERICIPQAGIYAVEANVYIQQNTPYGRGHPSVRFSIDGVGQPEKAVQYQRGHRVAEILVGRADEPLRPARR